MKIKFSTRLQLVLGLILMVLVVLFPPQGLVLLMVLSVLGYVGVRLLSNLLAKKGDFSYNWLDARSARAPSPSRPALRRGVPRFREWIETSVSLWLIAWVVMGLLLYGSFEKLTDLYYSSLDSVYLLTVNQAYWGILAMVAGAALGLVLSQAGMRWALREHYGDYIRQLDQQLGFRCERAAVGVVAAVVLATIVLIVPGLLTYTRLSSAGIVVRDVLGFRESVQSYRQVQSVQFITLPSQTRRGIPSALFKIDFADGTEWTTPHFDSRFVPPVYWDAVNHAARQSGRVIRRIALSDAFTKGASSWRTSIIGDDSAFVTRSIADGKYLWKVQSQTDATLWQAANMNPVSDLQLDLDCQWLDGSNAALCGTVFRQDAGDYYMFLIGQDQTIRLYLHYHDWITLIPPRQSSAVRPGAVNHITVNAIGSHFSFLVNDLLVAEMDDNTLRSGRAGVALQLPANADATIQFSNLEVLEK
jgi:hypothetical protein